MYGLIVDRGKGVLQRMQGHGEVKNAQGLGLWMKRGAERPKGRSRTWTQFPCVPAPVCLLVMSSAMGL